MKSTLSVSVAVTFFMMGCGSSSNNNGSINNGSGFLTPQGNYSMQETLPTSDTSRYTLGCQTGTQTSIVQIDPRLKPNQTFDYVAQGLSSAFNFSFSGRATIT